MPKRVLRKQKLLKDRYSKEVSEYVNTVVIFSLETKTFHFIKRVVY